MDITQGLEKPGKTRFAGWHYASKSIRRCLPAIEEVVGSGVIEVKKASFPARYFGHNSDVKLQDHKLAFIKNVSTCGEFKKRLYQLEKLTEPFAKAIKCLESGHSNPSDVFLFYMAVMATLRQLFDNNETELSLPDDVINQAHTSACSRYYSMVLASGQEVYLATFFLLPHKLFLRCTFLSQLTRSCCRVPEL